MRKFLLIAISIGLSTAPAAAESLYTDTWVNWSPIGKEFNVVCFTKRNIEMILKDVRILQLNRRAFQYKDTDGETKARASKDCFFEQKDPHPVSRDEFFEEIVSVKCSMNQIPFKDGDFRVLGTNSNTTSIKRLRDGKVWILPTTDCTFTTQLAKKPMMPIPLYLMNQQGYIVANPELSMFPGQSDQMGQVQPAVQPQPAPEPKPQATPPVVPQAEKKPEQVAPVSLTSVPVPPPAPTPEAKKTETPPPSENPNGTIKTLINSLN